MSDNKIKILQRLEAGEITAEEALNLMNQTESPTPPTANSNPGPVDPRQINPNKAPHTHEGHHHSHYEGHGSYENHEDYEFHNTPDWLGSLTGWVNEVVDDIAGSVKDLEVSVNLSDFIGGTYSHNKRTETFTSQPVSQTLAQLELNGKNDKIEIYAYDGNTVQINCAYDARRPDAYVYFYDDNGCISLQFDDKLMRSVRVICQVPRVHIGHIHAVTKNARIQVGGISAEDITLHTKNDSIFLESVNCGGLTANTRNESIKAIAVSGANILLETTNAKIIAEDIHATSLTLKTTNATIKTAGLDVGHLITKTTNARLKLEDTFIGSPALWEGERSLEAYTTNGSIRLIVPNSVGINLEANTTDSKVSCNIPLYWADNSTKTRLTGESMDYASASRKLNAILNTTNGAIKIFEG